MANTRTEIVNAIETRLKTIRTTSGYNTNLGDNVYLWRIVPLEDSECPAVIIRDMKDVFEDYLMSGNTLIQWHNLEVHLDVVAAENTPIDTIRLCLSDINTAILSDETWGSKAVKTDMIDNEIYMEQEGESVGGILIRLSVRYRTKKFNDV